MPHRLLHLRKAQRPRWRTALIALLFAGVVHIVLGTLFHVVAPTLFPAKDKEFRPISLVIVQPAKEREKIEEEKEEPEPPDISGQIVDVSPPEIEERPEEADYVAEYDQKVEEETKTEKVEINPEVLSREHSKEQKMEQENLLDLNVDKPSTGAEIGNERFDPDRDGALAALPSLHTLTNKEGAQDPVPSAHMAQIMSGAPSNDLLDVKTDKILNLNTKEHLYASYWNRIRRLVNYYWKQNLDGVPSSVRLAKPRYTTAVKFVLNADGALEHIEVAEQSGSDELDDCVTRAFRIAGPYPNPPEGLIEKDGRVYGPQMGFTVNLGKAQSNYMGVDPRAGVQFPGILKSPR